VERFNSTVLDEFFRTAFRTKLYETLDELQVDLDAWLVHYNTARPHQGYRNMGRRPSDTIKEFLENRQKEEKEKPVEVVDVELAKTVLDEA